MIFLYNLERKMSLICQADSIDSQPCCCRFIEALAKTVLLALSVPFLKSVSRAYSKKGGCFNLGKLEEKRGKKYPFTVRIWHEHLQYLAAIFGRPLR